MTNLTYAEKLEAVLNKYTKADQFTVMQLIMQGATDVDGINGEKLHIELFTDMNGLEVVGAVGSANKIFEGKVFSSPELLFELTLNRDLIKGSFDVLSVTTEDKQLVGFHISKDEGVFNHSEIAVLDMIKEISTDSMFRDVMIKYNNNKRMNSRKVAPKEQPKVKETKAEEPKQEIPGLLLQQLLEARKEAQLERLRLSRSQGKENTPKHEEGCGESYEEIRIDHRSLGLAAAAALLMVMGKNK